MRISTAMERNADSTGWGIFATTTGMITATHEVTQFGTAIVTLIVSIVVAHFLKRYLNERWPQQKRGEKEEGK